MPRSQPGPTPASSSSPAATPTSRTAGTTPSRAAAELAGIPQLLNSWLVTPEEAQQLGFAVYIHLGLMLRHFSDFRQALEELRDTGRVHVPHEDLSVEPVTRLLRRDDA